MADRADGPASSVREPDGDVALLRVDGDSLPREADRLLLARFAPACVLVNQALTILQFRGQTGPYLEPAGGPPSFDLRRVIRPELLWPTVTCQEHPFPRPVAAARPDEAAGPTSGKPQGQRLS